jgi:hypothetical protein
MWQLEELDLGGNPLKKVKHDGLKECRKITSLNLKNTKFRNYRGDLKFLKKLYELEVRFQFS